jgi:hypothetical protein
MSIFRIGLNCGVGVGCDEEIMFGNYGVKW